MVAVPPLITFLRRFRNNAAEDAFVHMIGIDTERTRELNVNALRLDQAQAEATARLAQLTDGRAVEQISHVGFVEVTGSQGGMYRLHLGDFSGNVRWWDPDGCRWETMCAHVTTAYGCSRIENILGQVLMLKTDEKTFRARARLL